MEDRIQKAVELFKSGYNCSQSVVAAFADMYGFTQEQALRMSASFGGGIGRMRETCGAACGMFLVAGLETGATEATDREGKAANYAVVQELAADTALAETARAAEAAAAIAIEGEETINPAMSADAVRSRMAAK